MGNQRRRLELDESTARHLNHEENFSTFAFTFEHSAGTKSRFLRSVPQAGQHGEIIVIGRLYFVRQAATLLKFAKSTANPELSAVLIEKAADLKSRLDDEITARGLSLEPPDVGPEDVASEDGSGFHHSASTRQ